VNLKVAFLLLLTFASTVTVTAVAFSIPAQVVLPASGSTVAISNSLVEPLGDPIDSPGHPT